MIIEVTAQSWPIRGQFTISRGSKTHVDVIVVNVQHEGVQGRGEAVPYTRYGETVESVIQQIKNAQMNPDQLPAGAARNALDCALWDLRIKQGKISLPNQPLKPVPLTYTLSVDTAGAMAENAANHAQMRWLKMKLAGDGLDLDRIRAVHQAVPNMELIIDANEGWDVAQYQELVPQITDMNVVLIEQPFPSDADDCLKDLDRPILVCADESCHTIDDLPRLQGLYDAVNIKLDKTGGLTHALELMSQAKAQGFQVMVGCMVCTSLSIAPAFIVGQSADICDLDGALLLDQDREHAMHAEHGMLLPPSSDLWG